jgi:hypothetical protein
MPCYSPLLGFKSRSNGGLTFRRDESNGEKMTVACGGCLGCRLDRSREWAARIVHEAQCWDDNCFITLTYDEEHMPRLWTNGPGTLVKSDFQKFMKRLRKRVSPHKVRYYQCGEYGEKLDRPHYHACLFNLDFPDKELFKQDQGNALFVSKTLSELWPYGFSTVGDLTFESAAYTARYCLKKVTGNIAQDHYLRVDDYGVAYWLEPEYTTMSRRPGIGKKFYEEFKDDLFPGDEVPVPGSGVFKKVPRYYETILKSEDEGAHEEVKRLRQVFRENHGDEYSPERLMQKYNVKKRQVGFLKRGIENEA